MGRECSHQSGTAAMALGAVAREYLALLTPDIGSDGAAMIQP